MIEQQLAQHMFSKDNEKTFIDKVLSRQDVERIRQLIKKPKLDRSELLDILYNVVGVEAKLANYSEWDRYLMNKFFVWLREFIKLAEQLFDYIEYLDKNPEYEISHRGKLLLENSRALLEHNCKFLIDLYLNIARTSMSIGATGWLELVRNKYEVAYSGLAQEIKPEKKGFLGLGGTK